MDAGLAAGRDLGHASPPGCAGDYISLSLTDGFDTVSLGRAATTASSMEIVVPFFPSTHLKVRVAYVVPCGEPVARFDASDATFTIDAPTPTVAMQTPSAGPPWPVGSWQLVSWTGPELPSGSCEYRSSALYAAWGTAREPIATPAFGQRSFLWKVPNRPGESVRFGVAINARCGAIDYALSDWTDPVPIGVAAVQPPELPDFDADGNPDILWHHQGNGEPYAWLMEGTVAARGTFLDPRAFTDTQWQMRALADLDADGDADVLWHHQGTGDLAVTDLNGDGRADLLWHHQGRASCTSGRCRAPRRRGSRPRPPLVLGHAVADPRGWPTSTATASPTSCGTTRRPANSCTSGCSMG